MRHASPRRASDRKLVRGARILLGVTTYAIAGLAVCTITLAATLTFWSLWQQLGVN